MQACGAGNAALLKCLPGFGAVVHNVGHLKCLRSAGGCPRCNIGAAMLRPAGAVALGLRSPERGVTNCIACRMDLFASTRKLPHVWYHTFAWGSVMSHVLSIGCSDSYASPPKRMSCTIGCVTALGCNMHGQATQETTGPTHGTHGTQGVTSSRRRVGPALQRSALPFLGSYKDLHTWDGAS